MSDPAEEFRKLAETTAALRRDVKTALEKSAPDHRRDFAEVLTALKKIEQKTAHDAAPGMLREAAERGAANGAKEASATLWEAAQILRSERERGDVRVAVLQWLWIFTALLGLSVGILFGMWTGFRFMPDRVIVTSSGCSFIGGTFTPAQPPQQPQSACVFWGK